MRTVALLTIACLCTVLFGCASTKVETSGAALKEPLCRSGGERISVVTFWQPKWRPNQKEPEFREAAALRGIRDFFASVACIGKIDIRRLNGEKDSGERPTDGQLLRLASTSTPVPDRVIHVVIRELGPIFLVGIPVIVGGGTEAVLEIRVLDYQSSRKIADLRIHWRNGGTFVIKGVETLPEDMRSALQAVLMSEGMPY